MQSSVMLASCRCDSSSSEIKDKEALSRGNCCPLTCFLSDLASLAWSQPLLKCSGKLVCVRREGRSARMTFCSARASFDCQLSAFPQTAVSPNPSPQSPAQSEGCGVAVAAAAVSGELSVSIPLSSKLSYLPPSPTSIPQPTRHTLVINGNGHRWVTYWLQHRRSRSWNYLNRGNKTNSVTLLGLLCFLWLHFIESCMHASGHVPAECSAKIEREPRQDTLSLLHRVRSTKPTRWKRATWKLHSTATLWGLVGAQRQQKPNVTSPL